MGLKKLTTEAGLISALAFDQRGALKKMLAQHQEVEPTAQQMETLKRLVSEELTPYASSILLDPEFGLPAAQVRVESAGLLLAYEKTGYDATSTSRLPDCLEDWSVLRLKEAGADAVKFLLYYDVDGDPQVNQQKQAYVERLGSECRAEGLPFFLEIVSYDEQLADTTSLEYARLKPHKVNQAMEVFSDSRFGVAVLKVEVPVNMNFVEGFATGEVAYSREEAAAYFREQDAATDLPYIYLSAGVSAKLFQDTLVFAAEAGAHFNGVLCGRATWAGVVPVYVQEGEEAARTWLQTVGRENLESLNRVLAETATPV
ncbi:tagatose-bisphosphate aldolase [Streptococcus sp. 10F2]